ncbi:hypothetical protein IT568_11770, partial [bacterium]|nr:hypothetical protein [bacterium]
MAQQRGNVSQINNLPVPVKPTLFIGLGGSGKEVLIRLRRLFYEKYRMVGLPIMEFLWFDTDTAAGGIGGRRFDLIDEKV